MGSIIAVLVVLALVKASPIHNVVSSATCSPRPYATPESWALCATPGHVYDDCTITTFNSTTKQWQDCYDACWRELRCISFSYEETNGTCRLLDTPIKNKGWTANSTSTEKFWSLRGCFDISHCEQESCSSPPTTTARSIASSQSVSATLSGKAQSAGSGATTISPPLSAASTTSAASGSSSTSTVSIPQPSNTLLPAVHWDYPVNDIRNLKPTDAQDLYYSDNGISDPAVEHLFASLSTTLQHDAVILNHSSYIESVSCDANGILVAFTTTEAYQYASVVWSIPEFVLVTYSDGCSFDDYQRTFWLINGISLHPESNSITAKVEKELAVEDIFDDVELIYGVYTPPPSTGSGSGGSGSSSSGSQSGLTTSTSSSRSGSGSSSSSTTGSPASSTPTSGSYSSGTGNSGNSCGAAPASTIDGFPAADCGSPNFDQILDKAIGYFDVNGADFATFAAQYLPDVPFAAGDLDYTPEDDDLTRRHLMRRGWNPFELISRGLEWVGEKLVEAGKGLISLWQNSPFRDPGLRFLLGLLFDDEGNLGSGVTDLVSSFPKEADTPYGKGTLLYTATIVEKKGRLDTDLKFYCVDCGFNGTFSSYGSVKWSFSNGVTTLKTGFVAENFNVGAHLAVVGNVALEKSKTFSIVKAPIPKLGFSIKDVFTVGLFFSADLVTQFNFQGQGNFIAGAVLHYDKLAIGLNVVDEASAKLPPAANLDEYKIFNRLEASVKAIGTANVSLPLALNLGFEIPKLNNFKRTVSIIEQPGFDGSLVLAASTSGAEEASDTCNNGIEAELRFRNDVILDLLSLKSYNLAHYEPAKPLFSTCYQFSPTVTSTTESSATETDESTTKTDEPETTTTSDEAEPTTDETESESQTTEDPSSTTEEADETSTATSEEVEAIRRRAASTTSDIQAASATPGSASTTPSTARSTSTQSTTQSQSTIKSSSTSATTTSIAKSTTTTTAQSTTTTDDDENIDYDNNPNDDSFFNDDPATITDSGNDPSDPDAYDDEQAEALDEANTEQEVEGFTYYSIQDSRGQYAIVTGEDGNLYPAPLGSGRDNGAGLFGTNNSIAALNAAGYSIHYYPDTMAKYGASRIRLTDETELPVTGDVLYLKPINYDNDDSTPSPLAAISTKLDVYLPVLCNFDNNAPSKLFIVSGQEGIDALQQNKDLTYIMTGAPVSSCDAIILVYGDAS